MNKVLQFLIRVIAGIIGKRNFEKLLIYSAKTINVNLYLHGLIQIGALNSFDSKINGEDLFIENTLADLLKADAKPVFFDVGANIGDFSLELRKRFPQAEIHSFEPVKTTYNLLEQAAAGKQIQLHNIGFSNSMGKGELFNTVSKDNNTIASAYKDVFHEIFKMDEELGVIEFEMDTIDNFCLSNGIKEIDFLKLDVEGHEFSVLQGAVNMLSNNHIKIIQFEFNSHNVHSRVFLRDFYLLLAGFDFYRIFRNGIIKLGPYSHLNEIFTLQNIVAIRTELCDGVSSKSMN